MYRFSVIFLKNGQKLRDRLFSGVDGRTYVYYAEGGISTEIDLTNPPQVMFCDDARSQEALAATLSQHHPKAWVIKAENKEMLTCKLPKNLPTSRAAWSEKGFLPV